MIIPNETAEKEKWLQFIVDVCTGSQQTRRSLYDKRRRYYLYGQNKNVIVRFNRLKSHMPLLASFLYASDQISYTVAAPKNADDSTVQKYLSIQDDWNESFQDDGDASAFDLALLWALVYDTMILKRGWNDATDRPFTQLIEPSSFGVFREDTYSFEDQQAMVHSYLLDYDDAVERLVRAGKASMIPHLQTLGGGSADMGLPGTLNQMIISATGGANIQGNIQGEVNPTYEESPSYTPKLDQPVVRFNEVWVWDTKAQDWRIFHTADSDVEQALILSDSKDTIAAIKRQGTNGKRMPKYGSDTNLFLPKENPFTPITPYPMYNYFWGDCHLEDLIPLQGWSNERLDQIAEILEQQVDPAKVFSGFMGIDDERAGALGGHGTWVTEQMPGAKVDRLAPEMPEDLFREFSEIGAMFMEQSGFTEIMMGKGEKNVRGRQHAQQLQTTGGGRVRKVASHLEEALVRYGDLGLRLKTHNDDEVLTTPDGAQFVGAQVLDGNKYTMRVAGHSHSPLFTQETKDLAAILFKAQAVDREWLIRLLKPPMEANLLHALRKRAQAEQAMAQQRQAAAAQGQPHGMEGAAKPRASRAQA